MTEKLKFVCEECGCEYEWYEEDGSRCHCYDEAWDWDDDYDFEETMGTA